MNITTNVNNIISKINEHTTNIKHYQENTFPEWIADDGSGSPFAYDEFAIVKYIDGNIYVSLVDSNNGEPTISADWQELVAFIQSNGGSDPVAGTGISVSGSTVNFYPFGLTTATTELTTSDYVVVSDSTVPKKITISDFSNELPLLGIGQTWQDVTGSRSVGVTYTNTTGRPIEITINMLSTSTSVSSYLLNINGSTVCEGGSYMNSTGQKISGICGIIIPNGQTYSITLTNCTISEWWELR